MDQRTVERSLEAQDDPLQKARLRAVRLRNGEEVGLEVGDLVSIKEWAPDGRDDAKMSLVEWQAVVVNLLQEGNEPQELFNGTMTTCYFAPWWFDEQNVFTCRVTPLPDVRFQDHETDRIRDFDLPVFERDGAKLLAPAGMHAYGHLVDYRGKSG